MGGGYKRGRGGAGGSGSVGCGGGGVQVGQFGVVMGGGPRWAIWGVGGGGGAEAPLTSRCPPSNHTITINLTLTFAASWFGMPAMLIGLNKIPPISFMAAFATSLLSILDPNTHSDPSLG